MKSGKAEVRFDGRSASVHRAHLRLLLGCAAAAVLLVSAGVVVREFPHEIGIVFRDAPIDIVPTQIRSNVAEIRRRAVVGGSILYVMDAPEVWYSRLWHRALYPTPLLIISATEVGGPRDRDLRRRFDVRWALSVGRPPSDPGFVTRIALLPDPEGRSVWFGELRR